MTFTRYHPVPGKIGAGPIDPNFAEVETVWDSAMFGTETEFASIEKELARLNALIANSVSSSDISASPRWFKYATDYTLFSAASLEFDYTLLTLPPRAFVHAVFVKQSIAFAGTGITAAALSVGIAGDLQLLLPPCNVLAAVSGSALAYNGILYMGDASASTPLKVSLNSVGANLNALTKGAAEVQLLLSVI